MSAPPTYRIVEWGTRFESAESRKLKNLSWVPIPTKHDGKTFRRLMKLPNGAAIYGAWTLIVAVAAKCPVRGILADEHGPLTAEDLSDKTGAPESLFDDALKLLASDRFRWLSYGNPAVAAAQNWDHSPDMPGEHPDVSGDSPDVSGKSSPRTEQKGTERKGKEETPPIPPQGGTGHGAMPPKKGRRESPPSTVQRPEDVPIPHELDTPAFRIRWAEWIADRRERRKPMTARAAEAALKQLSPFGPDDAIERIGRSIANGWQGVLYPGDKPGEPVTRGRPLWDDPARVRNSGTLAQMEAELAAHEAANRGSQ